MPVCLLNVRLRRRDAARTHGENDVLGRSGKDDEAQARLLATRIPYAHDASAVADHSTDNTRLYGNHVDVLETQHP